MSLEWREWYYSDELNYLKFLLERRNAKALAGFITSADERVWPDGWNVGNLKRVASQFYEMLVGRKWNR